MDDLYLTTMHNLSIRGITDEELARLPPYIAKDVRNIIDNYNLARQNILLNIFKQQLRDRLNEYGSNPAYIYYYDGWKKKIIHFNPDKFNYNIKMQAYDHSEGVGSYATVVIANNRAEFPKNKRIFLDIPREIYNEIITFAEQEASSHVSMTDIINKTIR